MNIKAKYNDGKSSVEVVLSLLSFKEDKACIIYSPAFDLCGSGYTEKKAFDSFSIALEEFIKYTVNKQTFLDELSRLGWQIKGSKKHPKILSPDLSSMVKKNKELEDIMNNKEFKKYNEKVFLPHLV